MRLPFRPGADTAVILHALLDIYERRAVRYVEGDGKRQAIRCLLTDLALPGYFSQIDPEPRLVTNEQLARLARMGHVELHWQAGEAGHLLKAVTLLPDQTEPLFQMLERTPEAARRAQLRDLLLGERFRFEDWRRAALQRVLAQLKTHKSPAPFSLTDMSFNEDLLAALAALDEVNEETPYRVFSVRVFNDSKRFEALRAPLARLARHSQREWRGWKDDEILRELNLVANPDHVFLYGPWELVDEDGQVVSLAAFSPSVGMPARQIERLQRVRVPGVTRVVCVENLTSFYELIQHQPAGMAAVCLWGNPSPAVRHLLRCLAETLPDSTSLLAWNDIDYGGLNILAQLRRLSGGRFGTLHMDVATLEAYALWAKPLTRNDVKNLERLHRRPELAAERPLIDYMLQRGLKLEQEAVTLTTPEHDISS